MSFFKYVITVRYTNSIDDWLGKCKINNELAIIRATLQIEKEFSHIYAPRSTYKGKKE